VLRRDVHLGLPATPRKPAEWLCLTQEGSRRKVDLLKSGAPNASRGLILQDPDPARHRAQRLRHARRSRRWRTRV